MTTGADGPRTSFVPPGVTGREVVVPGSTSNLGAGFDVFGLGLQLALRLRIAAATDDGRSAFECRFLNGPLQGQNAIERGFRRGIELFGQPGGAIPSLALDVASEIPMRAGLGSSAAALVAGLRIAELLTAPQPRDRLLSAACDLEGHPDNTSASLLGGFVVACRLDDGSVVARSTAWPDAWPLVVATPTLELETTVARAALADEVPLADAVFNLQRAALLVDAVHRQDADSARCAFADRLHQPQRARLVPGLDQALRWSDAGLIGVFLSGAGPSIAAVIDERVEGAVKRVRDRFGELYARLGLRATARVLRACPPQA